MKALIGAFNQEKALVGAFSVIVRPVVKPMDRFTALVPPPPRTPRCVQVCQREDSKQLHDPESELRGPADERQDAHRALQRILRRT